MVLRCTRGTGKGTGVGERGREANRDRDRGKGTGILQNFFFFSICIKIPQGNPLVFQYQHTFINTIDIQSI